MKSKKALVYMNDFNELLEEAIAVGKEGQILREAYGLNESFNWWNRLFGKKDKGEKQVAGDETPANDGEIAFDGQQKGGPLSYGGKEATPNDGPEIDIISNEPQSQTPSAEIAQDVAEKVADPEEPQKAKITEKEINMVISNLQQLMGTFNEFKEKGCFNGPKTSETYDTFMSDAQLLANAMKSAIGRIRAAASRKQNTANRKANVAKNKAAEAERQSRANAMASGGGAAAGEGYWEGYEDEPEVADNSWMNDYDSDLEAARGGKKSSRRTSPNVNRMGASGMGRNAFGRGKSRKPLGAFRLRENMNRKDTLSETINNAVRTSIYNNLLK